VTTSQWRRIGGGRASSERHGLTRNSVVAAAVDLGGATDASLQGPAARASSSASEPAGTGEADKIDDGEEREEEPPNG
jgi:hypothetical protein